MDCGHLFRLKSDPTNHNGIFPQLTNRCKEQEKSFHNKNIKVFSISGFCASFLRAETCFTDFISMGLHNYKHLQVGLKPMVHTQTAVLGKAPGWPVDGERLEAQQQLSNDQGYDS